MNNFLLLDTAAPSATDPMQLIFTFGSLIVFGIVLYFFIVRPQKKREKELKDQMSKMKIGDTVVTIGGLIGRVANIKDDEITISTSVANTLVTFQKAAINAVYKPEDMQQNASPKKEKKSKKDSEE